LPISTGLIAVVWAIGIMGHLNVPLDPFNATTPILILAVGAGHAVQLLKRYYEELQSGLRNLDSIVRSIENTGGVMIAAGSIAIASFLSLSTLGTHSMHTFGLLTAFGIASALLIELTLIPAIRSYSNRPPSIRLGGGRDDDQERLLSRIARASTDPRNARAILVAYGSVVILCGLLALRIRVDTSFKNNLSPGDIVRTDDDTLNKRFAGTNDLLFLFRAEDENTLIDPDAIGGISRFQDRMKEIVGVGAAVSYIDTLRIIHGAIKERDDLTTLPNSKELASQYLFLYSMSGGDDLGSILSPDHRIAKLSVLLRRDNTQYGEDVIRQARAIAAEELPAAIAFAVSGTLASNAALTEVMVRGKLPNVLQVMGITALVASAMFKSILLGGIVILPVGASLVVNFGLMGFFDIPMDVGSSVVCALSVGIGPDYAVYFLARIREEISAHDGMSFEEAVYRATTTSGTAVVYVASAIALGFLTLCLSGFRLFEQLGGMVAVAMVSAAGSTLIVLPALLQCLPLGLRKLLRSERTDEPHEMVPL